MLFKRIPLFQGLCWLECNFDKLFSQHLNLSKKEIEPGFQRNLYLEIDSVRIQLLSSSLQFLICCSGFIPDQDKWSHQAFVEMKYQQLQIPFQLRLLSCKQLNKTREDAAEACCYPSVLHWWRPLICIRESTTIPASVTVEWGSLMVSFPFVPPCSANSSGLSGNFASSVVV